MLEVGAGDVFVGGETVAGRVGQLDEAVDDRRRPIDQILPLFDIVGVEFDDEEIIDGRADMRAGDRADRARHIVRGDRDVTGIGPVGDLLASIKPPILGMPGAMMRAACFSIRSRKPCLR